MYVNRQIKMMKICQLCNADNSKAKIRDDEKAIEYVENGTIENKEKYVTLDRNYKD